ncbi:MAG: AbrB/MazE/SpoVT family DNA-binding domain-containing protein [Cetobacterium sp.]|uniref:AbrB/MazE/SpoVT family DNA-binding domain-containing protein n=1 Tax=Cetobacterium sp. TaxID=2071632 RepID=UPI003F31F148
MESRNLKVTFSKSGSGSITPRISLPITLLKEMGINPEEREVELVYNRSKKQIIIKKRGEK